MPRVFPMFEELEIRRLFVGVPDLTPTADPEINRGAIIRPGEGRFFAQRFRALNPPTPFQVEFKLIPKNFFTPFFNAPPSYDDPAAVTLGSILYSDVPDEENNAIISGKFTVPANITPGTYVIGVKLDST